MMTGQFRTYIMGLCLVGIISMLSGCPSQETPGHRPEPEPEPAQRQAEQEIERQTAEWAYQQGLQSLSQENFEDAIRYFQLAIERDALHVRAYLSLGDLYRIQEDYLIAETYYNQVLQYDPESIPAYTGLGAMNRTMGNYREALSLYRKVLEFAPGNQLARQEIENVTRDLYAYYYEQGMAYKEAGDLDSALKEFQKALSLYPADLEFTVEIGSLFLQQRDYMMADGYFQEALSRDPYYFPAILGAGKVQLALKHYTEAMEYFKKGQDLQPGDQETRTLLARARSEKIKSSLPPQYGTIETSEQITRGDIAALLMVELDLESRFPPPAHVVIISDITTHWAKPYIIKVVQLEIMGLPPDRYFRPNDPILKGELAFMLDTLFKKLALSLPNAGAVTFSDVSPENYYYTAVLRVYSAGLILPSAEDDNAFGISETLSGEEIMQIFARLKVMLR